MAAGYIYVLVNSSMPGLIKVGKTTRDPSLRAVELSGATGVATPFILAFEQFFFDCDAAEDFIHAVLERQGLRQTSNREFFRAQPNDVIRIILQTPGIADGPSALIEQDENLDDNTESEILSQDDPLPDLQLEGYQSPRPWDGIFQEAESYFLGLGENIQDFSEAIKLYKYSARLGSLLAYERLGLIYGYIEEAGVNSNTALEYFKQGAKNGNYYCYCEMSRLFFFNDQIENAHKSFKKFLLERKNNIIQEIEEDKNKIYNSIYDYLFLCLAKKHAINCKDELKNFKDGLLNVAKKNIDTSKKSSLFSIDKETLLHKDILRWIERNLGEYLDKRDKPKKSSMLSRFIG